MMEGDKINNSEFERHMQKLNIPYLITPSPEELQILGNWSKRDLRNIKAQASELRNFLTKTSCIA